MTAHPRQTFPSNSAPKPLQGVTQAWPGRGLPIYDARDMTDGGNQVLIQLDEQVYTLRITRAGKLILTK